MSTYGSSAGPDVVLLVGRSRTSTDALAEPEAVQLLGQLDRSYRLVARSQRSGLVAALTRGTDSRRSPILERRGWSLSS